MPQFLLSYLGGNHPATPEEGQQHFARYMEWMNTLGDAAVSPANPLGSTHCVNPDGSVTEGSSTTMSGFTIVEAESLEDALSMAKSCPFLEIDGVLEVSEIMQMPGSR
jgi:hypothetical protein